MLKNLSLKWVLRIRMKKDNSFLDMILYGVSYALAPIMSIFLLPIITKLFDPSIYGDYSYIKTIISMLSIIFLTWINPIILRYLNRNNVDLKTNTNSVSFLIQMCSLSFIAISAFLIVSTRDLLMLFIALDFLFKSLAGFIYAKFKANGEVKKYFINNILSVLCNYLVFFALLQFGVNSIVTIFVGTIIYNFSFLILIFTKKKKSLFLSQKLDKYKILDVAKFGIPFVLINLSGTLLNNGDRIVIRNMLVDGAKYVGIYTVNYGVYAQIISVLIVIITSLIPSYLYPLYDKGEVGVYKSGLSEFISFFLMISTIINIYVMINFQNINYILMDEDYIIKSNLPVILIVAYLFFGLYQLTANYFVASKKTHIISYFIIFSAILNLLLNIFFVPIFGFEFAAVSTLISFLVNFIVANQIVKTKLKGGVIKKDAKILIILNLIILIISYNLKFEIFFSSKTITLIYLILSGLIFGGLFIIYYLKVKSSSNQFLNIK